MNVVDLNLEVEPQIIALEDEDLVTLFQKSARVPHEEANHKPLISLCVMPCFV